MRVLWAGKAMQGAKENTCIHTHTYLRELQEYIAFLLWEQKQSKNRKLLEIKKKRLLKLKIQSLKKISKFENKMKKHYRRKNKKAMRRKFKKKYKEIRNPVEYLKNKT